MTTLPAGHQPPHTPTRGAEQPQQTGATPIQLTRTHKTLIGFVTTGAIAIAGIGFAGSYTAVTALAEKKGFGDFSQVFTLGIDIGIAVFLALDLLLTWIRIPFPLLRQGAWLLTAATICFNAAAAWPDLLGVSMHAVIPLLFVISVEAARHAIGRIADITADKHIDGVPLSRWLVAPLSSFRIWRRMRLWNIRSYATVIELEQEVRIYRAQLRKQHGRRWRRKAGADQLLVLQLTASGMTVEDAIDLPHREAQKRAAAEAKREAELRAEAEAEAEVKHQAEIRNAEAEAKRRSEVARAEASEVEAKQRAEAAAEVARLEVEAKRRAETEAARILVAETEAKLADIARAQRHAEAEADLKRRQQAAASARIQQEQQRAATEARAAAERRQREQAAQERAQRIASEAIARTRSEATSGTASGSGTEPTSGSDSASASGPRTIGGQRSKRQTEVEAVLARIAEADDPKSVSLEDVMRDFDLKQTTAYDRLSTAQQMWTEAKKRTA